MASWQPISPWRLAAAQNVTIGVAHLESTAVGAQTRAVLLRATSDCHVRIGQAPAAVATDTLLKATDPPIVLACSPGDKVSVIQDSAAGVLNVTELTH